MANSYGQIQRFRIDRQKFDIKIQLMNEGYTNIKEIGLRRMVCAISRFPSDRFPFAAFINFRKGRCERIYFFKEYKDAKFSLDNWDGILENVPGLWYQYIEKGKRYLNTQIPAVMHELN